MRSPTPGSPREWACQGGAVGSLDDLVDALGLAEEFLELGQELGPAGGIGDINKGHAALGDGGRFALADVGAEGSHQAGLLEDDVGVHVLLHLLEPVVGGDEKGGAVLHAGLFHCCHDVTDETVCVSERGVAGPALRTVTVVVRICVQRVIHQEVRLVLGEHVNGGLGPGGVAPGDVLALGAFVKPRDLLGREEALGDHFFLNGAFGVGEFRETPRDGGGARHRDPIGFRVVRLAACARS